MFERLPVVLAEVDLGGRVSASTEVSAALLVTHDCDLDKPQGKDGPPRIERVQFLPLRDLGQQDNDRQLSARRLAVAPAEVVYVGDVTGVGEAFGVLSELYYLPASFFDLMLDSFPEHPEAEVDARHLVARRHGNRLSRLDDVGVDLLRRKLSVWFTRGDPGVGDGLAY